MSLWTASDAAAQDGTFGGNTLVKVEHLAATTVVPCVLGSCRNLFKSTCRTSYCIHRILGDLSIPITVI